MYNVEQHLTYFERTNKMRTFAEINNEHLFIEAIRRLRITQAIFGGRTAPEGTGFDKVFAALHDSKLMTSADLLKTLNSLLLSKDVALYARASLMKADTQRRSGLRTGLISILHPDAKIAPYQYFTPNGTPITAKYDRGGNLIYPSRTVTNWSVGFRQLYVVSDGLPVSVQRMQEYDPIQPY